MENLANTKAKGLGSHQKIEWAIAMLLALGLIIMFFVPMMALDELTGSFLSIQGNMEYMGSGLTANEMINLSFFKGLRISISREETEQALYLGAIALLSVLPIIYASLKIKFMYFISTALLGGGIYYSKIKIFDHVKIFPGLGYGYLPTATVYAVLIVANMIFALLWMIDRKAIMLQKAYAFTKRHIWLPITIVAIVVLVIIGQYTGLFIEARYGFARMMENINQFDLAESIYIDLDQMEAKNTMSDLLKLWKKRGEYMLRQKNYPEAIEYLGYALGEVPGAYEKLKEAKYQYALDMAGHGQYIDAIKLLREVEDYQDSKAKIEQFVNENNKR